jgi:hypothetical protein
VWETTPFAITADEALAAEAVSPQTRTAKAECIEFLKGTLTGKWVEVADITVEAISAGLLSEGERLKDNKPMRAARTALKVATRRDGFGRGARYFWALPDTPWAPSNAMGAPLGDRAPMDTGGRP